MQVGPIPHAPGRPASAARPTSVQPIIRTTPPVGAAKWNRASPRSALKDRSPQNKADDQREAGEAAEPRPAGKALSGAQSAARQDAKPVRTASRRTPARPPRSATLKVTPPRHVPLSLPRDLPEQDLSLRGDFEPASGTALCRAAEAPASARSRCPLSPHLL